MSEHEPAGCEQADMEPCAEFGQHSRGGHAEAVKAATQEPPVDAQGGGGNEDTPDDTAMQAVEGAVPGDVYRTPVDWLGLQPTSPRCQYVSPTPWGPTQCALPDGHEERHAYSPSEDDR